MEANKVVIVTARSDVCKYRHLTISTDFKFEIYNTEMDISQTHAHK